MVDSELDLFPTVTATSNNRAVKENSIYIVDEKKAVIPKGYAISNKTNEQSIDNGLVVKKDGNEFVWIPVSSSDLFLMYTIEDTGLTMRGTEILTNYKSKQRADISSDLTRGYPETIDFIEKNQQLNSSLLKKAVSFHKDLFIKQKHILEYVKNKYFFIGTGYDTTSELKLGKDIKISKYELGDNTVEMQNSAIPPIKDIQNLNIYKIKTSHREILNNNQFLTQLKVLLKKILEKK